MSSEQVQAQQPTAAAGRSTSFEPNLFCRLGRSVTSWDLMVGVCTATCVYIILAGGADYKQIAHIAVAVLLYAFALRVVVVKVNGDQRLDRIDLARALLWTSTFVSYTTIRFTIYSAHDKKYVRAIMEGMIAFLFLFLSVKGGSRKCGDQAGGW